MGTLRNIRRQTASVSDRRSTIQQNDSGTVGTVDRTRINDNRARAIGRDRRAGTPEVADQIISATEQLAGTVRAPNFGTPESANVQAGAPAAATEVVAAEEQLAEDLIEEREEVLEESGGFAEATEELGDDPKEEIQVVKKSLRVLYSFNPTYTADEFIQSLDPDFRRMKVPANASARQKARIRKTRAQAKFRARRSVLIGKIVLKSGRTRIQDYKSISLIDEPVLNLAGRQFVYKPREERQLEETLSKQSFSTGSITQGINSFLEIPNFERIETPVIVNKFEIENQFRLSPIEDEPVQIEIESEIRTPPRIGSYLQTISPDRSTFRGTSRADDAFASRERPQVGGGGTGGGTRTDIDTGLIRDLDRDRQFGQQDFGAASDLEFDELETRGPPLGGNYGGGPRGY